MQNYTKAPQPEFAKFANQKTKPTVQPTEAAYFSDFGVILLFLIGGAVFILIGLGVSKLLRPNNPNPEKLSSYECGEEAVGSSWVQFNPRFYVIALIFIIFDAGLAGKKIEIRFLIVVQLQANIRQFFLRNGYVRHKRLQVFRKNYSRAEFRDEQIFYFFEGHLLDLKI